MPTLGPSYLRTLVGAAEAPCVSIYLPTAAAYPDTQQNPVRYKNLVRAAGEALAKAYPAAGRALADKLAAPLGGNDFWAAPARGLAVLASATRFDVFKLPREVPERVEVGETFHVKPLLRHVQSGDRYHVLGVSRDRVALFEGGRYELHPLDVPGIPLTRAAGLHGQVAPDQQFHTEASGPGLRTDHVADGAGGQKPEKLPLVDHFFMAVDRAVTDLVSNRDGLPVVLAGIEENLSEFRGVMKNRFVAADAVHGDWTHWSLPEIRDRAWRVFEAQYQTRLATLREDFGTAAARQMGTADPAEAARAGAAARIGTLLIDADKTIPGSIEFAMGEVRPADPADAHPGDVLDDLAELVLKTGGTVTVVPSDRMPTTTGLAAIFRY